jgi:hypothetical protein
MGKAIYPRFFEGGHYYVAYMYPTFVDTQSLLAFVRLNVYA